MRVLLVSNLVLDRTSNMGKTFLSYFSEFQPGEVAQFYIYSEVPTDGSVCRDYYRFTDWDALKSLFNRKKKGTVFGENEIDSTRTDPKTAEGMQAAVYRAGSRKTPLLHMIRNFIWKHSAWDSESLREWIGAFQPEAVFFASGDTLFMYHIARKISETYRIPLIVSTVDDYYVHNRTGGMLFGERYYRSFMKTVRETMDHASLLLPICSSMERAYRGMFRVPSHVLRTPVQDRSVPEGNGDGGISYIGNLDLNRFRSLEEIGRALRTVGGNGIPDRLDVYSQESDPRILAHMTEENGIRFHGAVSAAEAAACMERSLMVVHAEAFDPETAESVRYSVSTKIPESLMNGPCLLAYGPEGIESIDYLRENNAAYVITSPEDLNRGLEEILTDRALRETILKNARALAHRNHDAATVGKQFRRWIKESIENAG